MILGFYDFRASEMIMDVQVRSGILSYEMADMLKGPKPPNS